MAKIWRFCALLCVSFFVGNAFAAGYSCPSYKKYTRCSAGYYMTASSSSTTCNATPAAGNACRPCAVMGSNYICDGGTACPKSKTINIALNKNGGTGTGPVMLSCTPGATCALPQWDATTNNITKANMVFKGWATSSTATTGVFSITAPSSSTTYYAVWGACTACAPGAGANCTMSVKNNVCSYSTSCKTGYSSLANSDKYNPSCTPNIYTITLNVNGGTGGDAKVYEKYATAWSKTNFGTTVTSVAIPTKSGSVFNGYFSASSGGAKYIQATGALPANTTFTNNQTLFAQYSACTACSKGTGVASCNVSVSANKCTYSATCSSGYSTPTCTAAGACSCKANKYTVSFNVNGGAGGQSAAVNATYGSAMPAISTTAPTRTGYTFMGWYDNATYTSGTQYYTAAGASARAWNKTAAATLYAGWKANTYSCAAGQYLNTTACKDCEAGHKCNAAKTYTYNGAIQGRTPCSDPLQYQDATKQQSCKSVSVGYYKASNSAQAQCDAGYRDIAATSRNECRGTFTKTGSIVDPALPANCQSQTLNSPAAKTCQYTKKYNGTVVSDCTAEAVTRTRTGLTAKANFYVNGTTSCPACKDIANSGGFYPNSTAGNTGGATACRTASISGAAVAKNATKSTQCSGSTFKAAHTVNWGSSSTCDTCPTAEGGWTLGTGTGWTARTSCFETRAATAVSTYCSAGQLKKNAPASGAWPTAATISTSFQAKPGSIVSGQTCTQCQSGKYSAGGTATACTACPTTNIEGVRIGTWTGTSSEGASKIERCLALNMPFSGTTGSGVNRCFYTSGSGTTATYNRSCHTAQYKTCNAGYQMTYEGAYDGTPKDNNACTACAAGTYKSAAGTVSCSACSGSLQYQNETGKSSCKNVDSGYYKLSNSAQQQCPANYRNGTAATSEAGCQAKCAAGSRVATPKAACGAITSGNIYMLAHSVKYGATSPAAATCPSGYSIAGTTQADHDQKSDCKIICNGGNRVATTDAQCTQTPKGVFIARHTVSAGSTSPAATQCPANSYCPAGSGAATACSTLGLYVNSPAGSGANTDCYLTTTAGKYLAAKTDTAQTTCGMYDYCPATKLNYPNVGGNIACPDAKTHARTTYPADYYNPTVVPAPINQNWGTGKSVITQCAALYYGIKNARGSFNVETTTYNTTTQKYDVGGNRHYVEVNAGYYVKDRILDTYCNNKSKNMLYINAEPCPAGSYCPGYSSMPLCSSGTYNTSFGATTCVAGSYSAAGASVCTPCGAGKTGAAGATAASACTACTAITNLSTWAAPTWNTNNTMSNLCTVGTCNGSSYKSGNTCPGCPNNYGANTATGKTAISQCQTSCNAGYAVQTANEACKIVASGYQTGTHKVAYGSKTPTAADSTSPTAGKWYSCPASYAATGAAATNHDARTDCKISCSAGTQVAAANAACTTPNTADWYTNAHTVNAGSKSTVSSCLAAKGYHNSGTTAANHAGVASCKTTCSGGQYVATAGAGCVAVGTGYYCAGGTVAQNATLARTACTNGPANSAYTGGAASNACPWSCNSGYGQTSANLCAQYCAAGITELHLGNGVVVPLYAAKQTEHAIHVGYDGKVCYGSLAGGAAASALNVNMGGTTYHTIK